MLHPRAIDEFLDRALDSWAWIKKLSSAELDEALEELDFRPAGKKPLRKHQKASILLLLAHPHFALWLDMGTGKTRIVLEVLNHYWKLGKLHRAMILCISDEAVLEWENQIALWNIKLPHVGIGNSPTAEKWQAVAELGSGLIICTYAGFAWMFTERVKIKKKGKSKKKRELKPDNKRIDRFAENLQAFVWDESIHAGNYKSLAWRISSRMSEDCLIRIPMAGVPFGKEPQLIWAQQFLADRGESLGETLGLFRSAFYTQKRGYWTMFEYKFKKNMEPVLRKCMEHRSITYDSSECHDLPKVTRIKVRVELPEAAEAYYEKAVAAIKKAHGDRMIVENMFLRMRQISSGFLGYRDDESGERAQMEFDVNPKLDELIYRIEDMPDNRKFVIFYEFTWSGRRIMEELKKIGITAGWIWSGTKDSRLLRRKFDDEDPRKFKGLVAQWRKLAESANLQAANYKHYYESPVSVIMRKQADKRCFREGQRLKGFMYDYLATPADEGILESHRSGEDFFQALLRNPDKALREGR